VKLEVILLRDGVIGVTASELEDLADEYTVAFTTTDASDDLIVTRINNALRTLQQHVKMSGELK
jgi:hypothetical protein